MSDNEALNKLTLATIALHGGDRRLAASAASEAAGALREGLPVVDFDAFLGSYTVKIRGIKYYVNTTHFDGGEWITLHLKRI